MSDDNRDIRSLESPRCYLCGRQGKDLYVGLTDRLFGTPGFWNLKQCQDAACGLIWLDPMPLENDISLAYRRYYTHHDGGEKEILGIGKFGYRLLRGFLLRTSGLIKEQKAILTFYLGEQVPGKLVEIGCGAGNRLAHMRALGWTVEGVDIDPVACRVARQMHGLTVHEGTMESQFYPENTFDAIVSNHVIEHVFDPVALLKECHRIVKPDCHVVLITPNSESWGHNKFRECWRGLEPPRHIHIFSPKSIGKCADFAGFKKLEIKTTPVNADGFINGSLGIAKGKLRAVLYDNYKFKVISNIIYSLYLQYLEYNLWKRNAILGEEVVMICKK